MRNFSPAISEDVKLLGDNFLQIGQQTLKRLKPFFIPDPLVENYFKSINSPNPFMEELNATTLYLRIPS